MKPGDEDTRDFQPYFRAYAKAHGREPQAQIDHDAKEWPGGCMCGFILWMGARWKEWGELTGNTTDLQKAQNAPAFGRWLAKLSPAHGAQVSSSRAPSEETPAARELEELTAETVPTRSSRPIAPSDIAAEAITEGRTHPARENPHDS